MNISNFMTWFITQFVNIGTNMLGILDNIKIYGNISLMDFIITITILSAFISIIITAPRLTSIQANMREREKAQAKEDARYEAYWESKR